MQIDRAFWPKSSRSEELGTAPCMGFNAAGIGLLILVTNEK
jgi:hypothetical protein